jgi:hypothetical protein
VSLQEVYSHDADEELGENRGRPAPPPGAAQPHGDHPKRYGNAHADDRDGYAASEMIRTTAGGVDGRDGRGDEHNERLGGLHGGGCQHSSGRPACWAQPGRGLVWFCQADRRGSNCAVLAPSATPGTPALLTRGTTPGTPALLTRGATHGTLAGVACPGRRRVLPGLLVSLGPCARF